VDVQRAEREQKRAGGVAHQEVIMWLSAPDRLARARAALGRRLLVWNSKRAKEKRAILRGMLHGSERPGGQELITIEIDDSLRDTHTYPLSFPPKVLQRRKTTKPAVAAQCI